MTVALMNNSMSGGAVNSSVVRISGNDIEVTLTNNLVSRED